MTRQELYDEIKKSSKDEFIYQEMVKLGFWEGEKPTIPKELKDREKELTKELENISTNIKDPKKALRQIHKKRMKEALEKREENRKRREERAKKRLQEREKRKESGLGFIGVNYAKALKISNDGNLKRLEEFNLPIIKNTKELTQVLGIKLSELRFLTYHSNLTSTSHYVKFKISKKLGGFREISAPMPRLKEIQSQILEQILYKIPVEESVHGFVRGKNIVSNASVHLNKKVVINSDLENFFPTITFGRVQGLFRDFGYSTEIATIFAILLTEPLQKKITLDDDIYFLYLGQRVLPQGSPASPMISNLICRRLDRRLVGISKSLGFDYSRYADDLSFSANEYQNIPRMLFWMEKIIKEEGFKLHPKKREIMRKGSSQRVTGIIVNEKLSIPRRDLKRFRALLYQIEKYGLDGKNWHGKNRDLMATIWGYANFIKMVDSKKGEVFVNRVKNILENHRISDEEIKNSTKLINPVESIMNIFKKGENGDS